MPPPLDKAPQIAAARVLLSQDKLRPGDKATLAVEIELEKGWHIQAPDPGVEDLIPSKLVIEPIDGLQFDDQRWPAPKTVEVPAVGKVRQYEGKLIIRTPVTLTDPKMKPGTRKLWLMFAYQACNEAGICMMPVTAEAAVGIEIAPAGAEVRMDENGIELAMLQLDAVGPAGGNPAADSPETPLAWALLFGFLGGLILNVMPCVLPVISIKILSFVQQGGDDPGRIFRMGLAFCGGIMVWFWGFAALSAAGHLPLQYPSVVIGVGSVLFLMALNLFGVFEVVLPGSTAGTLAEFASKEGYLGSFFKGFLATLLGTACTAPFLATALVYAVTQPAWVVFLVFSAAGLGMAAPYLILAWKPGWLKFVPKPGPWMVTFKQAAGFVLVATAVWLLWIVGGLLGANGVVWTAAFWTFLAFSGWLIGKIDGNWESPRRIATWASALAIAVFGAWFSFAYMYEPEERHGGSIGVQDALQLVADQGWDEDIPWVPYAPGLADELSRRGYTVYVDYTARWCASCQYNKAAVLRSDEIWSMMRELGVIPIEADFTNKDPVMLKEIQSFGNPSVPLNLVYPSGRPSEVSVLPVLLTNAIVREALRKAGPSTASLPAARADSATSADPGGDIASRP
jgi:thiol:disulfide interchange protein DsbD